MQLETAVNGDPAEAAVIRAKLRPPQLPDRRVARPRLERRLAELIERHPVVVVSASPGAGKSTAVAAAVGLLERPMAWLTLDRTDAAAGRLVTYLQAALARHVPQADGVASRALAARIPHAEAAGLLAEAVGETPLVFVLDELERLGEAGDAWAVIEAFVRYSPPAVWTVLISRRRVPDSLLAPRPREGAIAVVGEADLAFTLAEAAQALTMMGETTVDPAAAVEATGGWVTGVLFEAWRSAEHEAGRGGDADPLYGYLSSHMLAELGPEDREFLVATSLLDEVTAQRAAALVDVDAAERLTSLRAARLPVSWQAGGRALRCHPRFREYLLDRLERRSADEVRAAHRAYGRLLAQEGHAEDATEELLRGQAPKEALATAEQAIVAVIERLDFAVAERWLEALGKVVPTGASPLSTAELMLALVQDDFRRAERTADRLAAVGERDRLARSSPPAAALMGWCYAHRGRLDDVRAVLAAAEPGPGVDILRYFTALNEPGPPPARPELTGGPLDAFVLSADYVYGRLTALLEERATGWVDVVAEPWRIAALSAAGHTQRALELYEAVRAHGVATAAIDAYVGPQLLIDAGRGEEARETIARGRRLARRNGSLGLELSSWLAEARLALRLDGDPSMARAALDRLERQPGGRLFAFIAEQHDTWYGLALLRQSEHAAALSRLRAAVDGMLAGDRLIELPTAAVYLAEAEWHAGDEEAADRAADLALAAARRQGSNHLLLQALSDLPAVVSRRIDAEPGADSPWHELGRALIAQGVVLQTRVRASVQLKEFGRCEILVNGEEVRPRIAKTYELLGYLSTRPGKQADRDELLDALFEGRSDDSTRAYLR